MHVSCLFIFFTEKSGIGIGHSAGQLGCSLQDGSVVLGGDTVSNLTVRFVPQQQHFKLLDIVTRNFLKPLGSMGFVSLLFL